MSQVHEIHAQTAQSPPFAQERQPTPEDSHAHDLASLLYAPLNHSPSNPDYRESHHGQAVRAWLDAHREDIERATSRLLQTLVVNPDNSEVPRTIELAQSKHPGKMFQAHEISYAGMEDVMLRYREALAENDIHEVDQLSVSALSAHLVRIAYFTQLAEADPRMSDRHYERLLRQNSYAIVGRAALLSARTITPPHADEPSASNPQSLRQSHLFVQLGQVPLPQSGAAV